jgi:hypothetical protein
MNIKWNEVTWYSKLGAVIFFLGFLPILTFYMGMRYQEVLNTSSFVVVEPIFQHISDSESLSQSKIVTIEKLSRYINTTYGFSIDYPTEQYIVEERNEPKGYFTVSFYTKEAKQAMDNQSFWKGKYSASSVSVYKTAKDFPYYINNEKEKPQDFQSIVNSGDYWGFLERKFIEIGDAQGFEGNDPEANKWLLLQDKKTGYIYLLDTNNSLFLYSSFRLTH